MSYIRRLVPAFRTGAQLVALFVFFYGLGALVHEALNSSMPLAASAALLAIAVVAFGAYLQAAMK